MARNWLAQIQREAIHTTRLWGRDGRWVALLCLWGVACIAAVLQGLQAQRQWQADGAAANTLDQANWLAQGAGNPHSVAHYGQYAFKPAGPLQAFDPGVTAALGLGIWLEAHYQNPATLRPIERAEGEVLPRSAAALLQWGLPLLLIVAGAALWAEERESGRWRLMLAQGTRPVALLLSRGLVLLAVGVALWLPLAVLALWLAGARGAWLALSYAMYLGIWVSVVLGLTMLSRGTSSALAALLGFWLLTTVLAPRWLTHVAAQLAPLPSPEAFWSAVRTAQAQGVDGHASADARSRALLERTLAEYGVSSEQELPISFVGIAMQAGEEHGNQIYDEHYGRIWHGLQAQDAWRTRLSLWTPLLVLDQLSQWAAGTDWRHHRHFVDHAEAHRRALQRFLNEDFTRHAKGKNFDYQANPTLWAQAPRWHYTPPGLTEIPRPPGAWMVLSAWLLAGVGLMLLGARRLRREVSA